jgi:hypothetical protein
VVVAKREFVQDAARIRRINRQQLNPGTGFLLKTWMAVMVKRGRRRRPRAIISGRLNKGFDMMKRLTTIFMLLISPLQRVVTGYPVTFAVLRIMRELFLIQQS